MRRPGIPLLPVLATWGVSVGVAFWHFEGRYLRPVARPHGAARAQPERRPLPPLTRLTSGVVLAPGRLTLLHFYSPDCPCSRDNEPHLRDLITRYAPENVRFIAVVECGASPSDQKAVLQGWRGRKMPLMETALDAGGGFARAFGVWATPGAVILDRRGRVAYTGGFNAARFCHEPTTAWAAQAMEALIVDRPVVRPSQPFYGCQVAGR